MATLIACETCGKEIASEARTCPHCGAPIERQISLCSMATTQSSKSMLSDKNLKQKGFTKLVNEGGGKFRKVT